MGVVCGLGESTFSESRVGKETKSGLLCVSHSSCEKWVILRFKCSHIQFRELGAPAVRADCISLDPLATRKKCEEQEGSTESRDYNYAERKGQKEDKEM